MIEFREETHITLGSSNNVVKRAIEQDCSEGLVVCTYEQTAGYGRLGRSWVSPFGGLYFSLLLRPQRSLLSLPTLGLVVALAMRRTIAGFVPSQVRERVQIKWPNDVILTPEAEDGDAWGVTFDKLCGISFERHAGATCIGIGVNVFHPCDEQLVGGKNAPAFVADLMGASIEQAGVSATVGQEGLTDIQKAFIDRIRSLFLGEFSALYDRWNQEGFEFLLDEYSEHLCLRGKQVSVVNQLDQSMLSGMVMGVDSSARLLLQTEFGTIEAVGAGEVTLV